MPRPKSNKETDGIRRMVHVHLRRRAQLSPPVAPDGHLDDDCLSAYTEGRLNDNEALPVIKHLVACSSCRHITAELVRLNSDMGDVSESSPVTVEEPGRIRRLLDDLASRVFVASDDEAVFAYHAPAEDFKKDVASDEKESKDTGEGETKGTATDENQT